MFDLTVSQVAALCGGTVYGGDPRDPQGPELSRIVIDSRAIQPGDLFVAYRGEKSDGHNYIISALEKGASAALAEHLPKILPVSPEPRGGGFAEGGEENLLPGPVIVCRNVQTALEEIARAFRKKLEIPVIGVTGSVGKTTAKEIIASVLSQRFRVHKTEGNQNNTIGVPLSLSGITRDHQCAVLEMGINHFGEMRRLGSMAAPDIAVFTNIGHAHLEFLGDLNGVLRAKTEMLEFMSNEALLIVNGDDPLLRNLDCRQWKMTYGKSPECEVFADQITVSQDGCISCLVHYAGRTLQARAAVPGEHMVYAVLEGAAAGFAMGLSDAEIERGIAAYAPVGRRFSVQDLGRLRLVDDCYNANPDSTRSSVASLMDLPGRHVFIFGNMRELGQNAEEMHREIGRFAKAKGVDLLLTCGDLAGLAADAYNDPATAPSSVGSPLKTGSARRAALPFLDKASLISAIPDLLTDGDVVLVKASLGSRLDEVSEAVKALASGRREV